MQPGKLLTGILVTVISGIIAVAGMVWAIIHYAAHGRDDLHTFPVSVEVGASGQLGPVTLAAGKEVSIWLLLDSRAAEQKSFSFSINLEAAGGAPAVGMATDFSGMTLRNRFGNKVYYWLGDHTPAADTAYRISYRRSGSWPTQQSASLVIRRTAPFDLPGGATALLAAGISGLFVGVRMLLLKRNPKTGVGA